MRRNPAEPIHYYGWVRKPEFYQPYWYRTRWEPGEEPEMRQSNRPDVCRVNRRIRRNAVRTLAKRIVRAYPDSRYGSVKLLTAVLSAGLLTEEKMLKLTRLKDADMALYYTATGAEVMP